MSKVDGQLLSILVLTYDTAEDEEGYFHSTFMRNFAEDRNCISDNNFCTLESCR